MIANGCSSSAARPWTDSSVGSSPMVASWKDADGAARVCRWDRAGGTYRGTLRHISRATQPSWDGSASAAFEGAAEAGEFLVEGGSVAGGAGQAEVAEVAPDAGVEAIGGGVVAAGLAGGAGAAPDLGRVHVRVEEGAAVGGVV